MGRSKIFGLYVGAIFSTATLSMAIAMVSSAVASDEQLLMTCNGGRNPYSRLTITRASDGRILLSGSHGFIGFVESPPRWKATSAKATLSTYKARNGMCEGQLSFPISFTKDSRSGTATLSLAIDREKDKLTFVRDLRAGEHATGLLVPGENDFEVNCTPEEGASQILEAAFRKLPRDDQWCDPNFVTEQSQNQIEQSDEISRAM